MTVQYKTNADTFRKRISRLARELEARPSAILINLVPAMVEELALRSVIGDNSDPSYRYDYKPEQEQGNQAGWFASNWQVTFGAPADTPRENAGTSQAIGHSIDQAFADMVPFRVKSTPNIFISNPVPYADRLEYTDHAKKEEHRGIMQQVLALYPKLLDDAILKTALQNKN